MTYTLRDHQVRAIQGIHKSMSLGNKRVVLKAPCGFGKTLVSVDIINSALKKGKKVLFIVDSIQLIDQTSEVFDKHNIDHGVIQADHWRCRPFEKVQLASAQTLKNRKLPDVDLVIWDEGHIQHSFIIKLITEIWNKIFVITLTATPFAKNMGNIHQDLVCVETTKRLIDKDFLSSYTAYGCTIDLDGVKVQAGDYNQKQLDKKVNQREIIGDIVSTWKRLGDNRQTLCFAVTVAHSEAIVREFISQGVPAAHMDSFTDAFERNEIFKKHESGEIKILSNVGITTKGYDSPNSTCLILARPVLSLMLFHQMCGRVLRVAENGQDAIILDHGNCIQKNGFPCDETPTELDMGEKKDKNQQKKEEIEKEIKTPKPCIQCGFLSRGTNVCPNCGNKFVKDSNVIALEGELKKLKCTKQSAMQKRNKTTSKADKQAFYSAALGYARKKGYVEGWAAHAYHDRFSVYPNAMNKKTGSNTPEFQNFITARNIKFANRKKR